MTEETKRRSPRRGGHAARMIFQIMMGGSMERKSGFTIENAATLLHGRGQAILGREPGRRGFPAYPEPPRLFIDPKAGRPPSDWEYCGSEFMLISGRLKAVPDAVDPDGCAFLKCDVRHARGEVTDSFWLMDVVRVLDAIDESASCIIRILYDNRLPDGKSYLIGGGPIDFKRDAIGTAHIFVPRYAAGIFCDGELKNACRRAGIRGMSFRQCG